MFEMVDDESLEPKDRKSLLLKIGAVVVILAALGGVVYFMAMATTH
jgi:flagellar basal body-associated protein FliL